MIITAGETTTVDAELEDGRAEIILQPGNAKDAWIDSIFKDYNGERRWKE